MRIYIVALMLLGGCTTVPLADLHIDCDQLADQGPATDASPGALGDTSNYCAGYSDNPENCQVHGATCCCDAVQGFYCAPGTKCAIVDGEPVCQ